jgi:phosphoribosylaminoimidazole carboxylase PurE protein
MSSPLVGIIMGSDSDLEQMSEAAKILDSFEVSYEVRVVSAHRTPDHMIDYARTAAGKGLKIIIAGAGGSAHLPGMTASETILPVIAVPLKRKNSRGQAALLSNIAMPPGIPLATMPENGSKNAGLLAVRILALSDFELAKRYEEYVSKMREEVLNNDTKLESIGWQEYLNQ